MPDSTEVHEWATLDEAAAILRMSRPTVIRLVLAGEISGRKIGKKWRIDRRTITPRYPRAEQGHTNPPLDAAAGVGA
jgi:excisionase family DNA binding protein